MDFSSACSRHSMTTINRTKRDGKRHYSSGGVKKRERLGHVAYWTTRPTPPSVSLCRYYRAVHYLALFYWLNAWNRLTFFQLHFDIVLFAWSVLFSLYFVSAYWHSLKVIEVVVETTEPLVVSNSVCVISMFCANDLFYLTYSC